MSRLVFGVDKPPVKKIEYKVRRRLGAIATCPECGKEVKLYQETEEWDDKGHHAGYGPSQGACCGVIILDDFNGCHAYRSRK